VSATGKTLVRLSLVLLFLFFVAAGGCAAAPAQEMSNARQAIAVAEEAGAGATSAELLQQARDLLVSAEEKLQRHNFIGARTDATNARLKAVEALERTQAK
jgi:hypothetical protein